MSFTLGDLRHWFESGGIRHEVVGDASDALVLEGATVDSRKVSAAILFCAVQGETTHGARFLPEAFAAGAPAALVEGGSAAAETIEREGVGPYVLVDDARAALAAAAKGWLAAHRAKVVGITGSNGKTTTKDLLRAALGEEVRAYANPGNLNSRWGMPLAILGAPDDVEVLTLEMGASEPGEIAVLAGIASPWMGCVTNVGPAHLERFGSIREVARTKGALLAALPADGVGLLCADDANADRLREMSSARRTLSFGWSEAADVVIEAVEQTREGLRVEFADLTITLPLFGAANALNAAAAWSMACELGVDPHTAAENMERVRLSGHRSERLELGGRVVIDDCYNANPASVRASLESLAVLEVPGRHVAVLGDMAELGADVIALHLETLGVALEHADLVFTLGDAYIEARSKLVDHARVSSFARGAFDEVAAALHSITRPGDAILLKGSRSAGLESVLERLSDSWASGPATEKGAR